MALDPEKAERIPRRLISIYNATELTLLNTLATSINRGLNTDNQPAEAQRFRNEAQRLANGLAAAAPNVITQAAIDSVTFGRDAADEDINLAGHLAAKSGRPAGLTTTLSVGEQRLARKAAADGINTLTTINQQIPNAASSLYQQVTARVNATNASSEQTRRQAAQQALDILTARGITGFRDNAGRNWSLSTYVEMKSRTLVNNTLMQAHIDTMLARGLDLVVVSSHRNPAPQCQPFEGQILSIGEAQAGSTVRPNATGGAPVRVRIKATMDEARARGFRHPNCFPGGTLVSAQSGVRAADRRWYQGETVVIHTASGVELTATPNHPVLTTEGWVAAGGLTEGSHVVRHSGSVEGAGTTGVPHDQDVPARISDVFDALRHSVSVTPVRVPSAAEQFHGDGEGSEVEVVLADGLLQYRVDPAGAQLDTEGALLFGGVRLSELLAERASFEVRSGADHAAHSIVSSGSVEGTFERGHLGVPHPHRVAEVSADSSPEECSTDGGLATSEQGADLGLRHLAGLSETDGLVDPTGVTLPGDAEGREFPVESGDVDSDGGRDLFRRLAGLVSTDRVVNVERRDFAGHVYNLETGSGWYVAGSIIVHNCRHSVAAYIPGASRTFTTEPNEDGYKATQRQRALERTIRDTKRRQATTIDPGAKKRLSATLRSQQETLKQHIAANDLKRRSLRERPDYGYNVDPPKGTLTPSGPTPTPVIPTPATPKPPKTARVPKVGPGLEPEYGPGIRAFDRQSLERLAKAVPPQAQASLRRAGVKVVIANDYRDTTIGDTYQGKFTADGRPLSDTTFYDPTTNTVLVRTRTEGGSVNPIAHELGHALDLTHLKQQPAQIEWETPGRPPRTQVVKEIADDPYLQYAHTLVAASNVGDTYYKTGSAGDQKSGLREWIAESYAALVMGNEKELLSIAGGRVEAVDLMRWAMTRYGVLE